MINVSLLVFTKPSPVLLLARSEDRSGPQRSQQLDRSRPQRSQQLHVRNQCVCVSFSHV